MPLKEKKGNIIPSDHWYHWCKFVKNQSWTKRPVVYPCLSHPSHAAKINSCHFFDRGFQLSVATSWNNFAKFRTEMPLSLRHAQGKTCSVVQSGTNFALGQPDCPISSGITWELKSVKVWRNYQQKPSAFQNLPSLSHWMKDIFIFFILSPPPKPVGNLKIMFFPVDLFMFVLFCHDFFITTCFPLLT